MACAEWGGGPEWLDVSRHLVAEVVWEVLWFTEIVLEIFTGLKM